MLQDGKTPPPVQRTDINKNPKYHKTVVPKSMGHLGTHAGVEESPNLRQSMFLQVLPLSRLLLDG